MKMGDWGGEWKTCPSFGNGLKRCVRISCTQNFRVAITACCISQMPQFCPPSTSPFTSFHPLPSAPDSVEHIPILNLPEKNQPLKPGALHTPPGASRVAGRRDPAAAGASLSIQCVSPPFPTFPGRSWHGSGRSWVPARRGERLKLLKVEQNCSVAGPQNNWGGTSFCLFISLPTQTILSSSVIFRKSKQVR